ncbi:unnamed protein product, partial [Brassica oleracea]
EETKVSYRGGWRRQSSHAGDGDEAGCEGKGTNRDGGEGDDEENVSP